MAKHVFIFGAGASKAVGGPLMNEVFQFAKRNVGTGDSKFDKDFQLVQRARKELKGISLYRDEKNENLEEIYAAVEMGQVTGTLPNISENDTAELRHAIESVMTHAIDRSLMIHMDNIESLKPYLEFTKLVKHLGPEDCTVITFNYDCILEWALDAVNLKANYHLTKDGAGNISILKLHGSFNWGWCDSCERVSYHPMDVAINGATDVENALQVKTKVAQIQNSIKCSECSKVCVRNPFLVPPTFSKAKYYEDIQEVWKIAASRLEAASTLVVCGYSLPQTDVFFNHFLALALGQSTLDPEVMVFNPDASLKERYKNVLGYKIKYVESGFEEMVNFLKMNSNYEEYSSP